MGSPNYIDKKIRNKEQIGNRRKNGRQQKIKAQDSDLKRYNFKL